MVAFGGVENEAVVIELGFGEGENEEVGFGEAFGE